MLVYSGVEVAFLAKETARVLALHPGEGGSFKELMEDHGGRSTGVRGQRIVGWDT